MSGHTTKSIFKDLFDEQSFEDLDSEMSGTSWEKMDFESWIQSDWDDDVHEPCRENGVLEPFCSSTDKAAMMRDFDEHVSLHTTHQWQDARGNWHDYSADADQKICDAIIRDRDWMSLVLDGAKYTLDFETMQQERCSSGRQRPMRARFRTFQWQDGRGQWHPFDHFADSSLALAMAKGHRTTHVRLNGSTYTFDFERMEQMNNTSYRVRPIRSSPLQFQWADDQRNWCMFSEVTHASIGWAYVKGQRSTTVSINDGLHVSIDFLSMQQTSLMTGRCRELRVWSEWESSKTSALWSDKPTSKSPKVKTSCADSLLLKVLHGSELRRSHIGWNHSRKQADKFYELQSAVADLFEFDSDLSMSLQYSDGDDWCTLAVTTVDDCLSLMGSSTLSLRVQVQDRSPSSESAPNLVDEFKISTPRSDGNDHEQSDDGDMWSFIG